MRRIYQYTLSCATYSFMSRTMSSHQPRSVGASSGYSPLDSNNHEAMPPQRVFVNSKYTPTDLPRRNRRVSTLEGGSNIFVGSSKPRTTSAIQERTRHTTIKDPNAPPRQRENSVQFPAIPIPSSLKGTTKAVPTPFSLDHSAAKRDVSVEDASSRFFGSETPARSYPPGGERRTRQALADIWANASTFPKGLDGIHRSDRTKKRDKTIEQVISQGGVNVPRALTDTLTFLPSSSLSLPPGLPLSPTYLSWPRPAIDFNARPDTSNINGSRTHIDKNGCVQLGENDLCLSFTFSSSSHFEFWDLDTSAYIICSAQISLLAKDPTRWHNVPLSLPNIRMLDIHCSTQDVPTAYHSFNADPHFAISYIGARTSDEEEGETLFPQRRGIVIEPPWKRVARFGALANDHKRGFYVTIQIPIPARLFLRKETRIFSLQASVWIGSEDNAPVTGHADITITHLRREREMC